MIVQNWNKNPSVNNAKLRPYNPCHDFSNFCIRGNGRSYGDASLNEHMISMLNFKETLSISGSELTVSAGYTLGEVLNYCMQKRLFMPVIPGTQHVTIGGMVAADVHGKNHQENGTIGSWISELQIRCVDGETITASQKENTELFKATIGGMGLTGIVETVKIKLIPLVGSKLTRSTTHHPSFSKLLTAIENSQSSFKVGWLDLINGNNYFLIESDFIEEIGDKFEPLTKAKLSVPNTGIPFVSKRLMKLYNKRYTKKLKRNKNSKESISSCFFPLDSINNWNRLYGKRGFYQYQFILPKKTSIEGFKEILLKIDKSDFKPVLAVLKKHSDSESPGIISFPMNGFSLALDFINKPGIVDFLHALDEVVCENEGRVYLAKDSLLKEETFHRMYTQAENFKKLVHTYNQGQITSLMAKRLNLVSE